MAKRLSELQNAAAFSVTDRLPVLQPSQVADPNRVSDWSSVISWIKSNLGLQVGDVGNAAAADALVSALLGKADQRVIQLDDNVGDANGFTHVPAVDMSNCNRAIVRGGIASGTTVPAPTGSELGDVAIYAFEMKTAFQSLDFDPIFIWPGAQPNFAIAQSLKILVIAIFDGTKYIVFPSRQIRSLDHTLQHIWTASQSVADALMVPASGAIALDASKTNSWSYAQGANVSALSINTLPAGFAGSAMFLITGAGNWTGPATIGVPGGVNLVWPQGGPPKWPVNANSILEFFFKYYSVAGVNTLVVNWQSSESRYPAHLGDMTWAALQTAYPNGSAALAALPIGTQVTIIDQGGRVTWLANNTRWDMQRGGTTVLAEQTSGMAALTDATATETTILTVTIPKGKPGPNYEILVDDFDMSWPVSTADKTFRLKANGATIATMNSTGDTAVGSRLRCRAWLPDAINAAAASNIIGTQGQGQNTPTGDKGAGNQTTSINTETTDITLTLTAQWVTAGSGSQSITFNRALLLLKRP